MYRDPDDVRLSEHERRVLAELEAALSDSQPEAKPRPSLIQWIGPAAVVATGTMLMALATVTSLWLIVFGTLLIVGGIALLAVQ